MEILQQAPLAVAESGDEGKELEVDMDQLDNATLWKLRTFVDQVRELATGTGLTA